VVDLISPQEETTFATLSFEEKYVMDGKATEVPFTGKYYAFWEKSIYVCKRCRTALYRSENKFEAGCGWPSFDEEIPGAVERLPDFDGGRTEIRCDHCGAHLGHVLVCLPVSLINTIEDTAILNKRAWN